MPHDNGSNKYYTRWHIIQRLCLHRGIPRGNGCACMEECRKVATMPADAEYERPSCPQDPPPSDPPIYSMIANREFR